MRLELEQISDKFADVFVDSFVHYSLNEENNVALITMAENKISSWFIVEGHIDKDPCLLNRESVEFITKANFTDLFEFRFHTARKALEAYNKYLDKTKKKL